LAENWSRTRDVNGRDPDETETLTYFCRDETEMRRLYVSRPRRRDPRPQPCTFPKQYVRFKAIV